MNLSFKAGSKQTDWSRQTWTEKELAQAGQEIAKNTGRAEPVLFARESSATFVYLILTTFIQLAAAFYFWMFFFSIVIILNNNPNFSG